MNIERFFLKKQCCIQHSSIFFFSEGQTLAAIFTAASLVENSQKRVSITFLCWLAQQLVFFWMIKDFVVALNHRITCFFFFSD